MAEPPEPKMIHHDLNAELTEAVKELAAVQAAEAEGREGPIEIPAEQSTHLLRRHIEIALKYLPLMAAELDQLRWDAARRGVYGDDPSPKSPESSPDFDEPTDPSH